MHPADFVRFGTAVAHLIGPANHDAMSGKYYARFTVKDTDDSDSYLRQGYRLFTLHTDGTFVSEATEWLLMMKFREENATGGESRLLHIASGLSTAMQLLERYAGRTVWVLEKEAHLASHQTGRNSGVIHAGVYYAAGSLKARFCREGNAATLAFSHEHGLPVEQCGKLIVATNDVEVSRLAALQARCVENGLEPERLDGAALRRTEPRIVGKSAILVRASGIADYAAIARRMGEIVTAHGGQVVLGAPVIGLRVNAEGVTIDTPQRTYRARYAIICAGLMADRLMRMCGLDPDFRIVPFRGEYFRLSAAKNDIVRHLIYPVPDPGLPFLGVHLTRMIGGYVTVGPNAVLALAREGHGRADVNAADLWDMARFPVVAANWRSGLREIRNLLLRKSYLAECRKYCPELTLDDLQPHPAGVRAQAVMRDGSLADDFLVRRSRRTLHVCNAPSPAATSAIPIGRHLVNTFHATFGSDGVHAFETPGSRASIIVSSAGREAH